MAQSGVLQLKKDLKTGKIGSFYLIYGEENYLKKHYLKQLEIAVVEETFRDFNLHVLEGGKMTLQELNDAIESYPAMAERKMVLVKDFDPLKANTEWREGLLEILKDLPEYICLVFYFETLSFKPDKRVKLYSMMKKIGCIAEFAHLQNRELMTWIQRHARADGKNIDQEACEYMLYLCGTSMVNLLTEIGKVSAYTTGDTIERKHIDAVCSKTMDAVIFDLTDAIGAGRFHQALQISRELISQKNEPVALMAFVSKHIQKLYGVKLLIPEGQDAVMSYLENRSNFYAKKMIKSAGAFSLRWLRDTLLLCSEIDFELKSTGTDKEKTWELLLLKMAESKINDKN